MTIPNDPLHGKPFMHIFRECVWDAEIPCQLKIVLLFIARFVDAEGKGCSVSYPMLARKCGISEATAKRVVKALKNTWLTVEVAGGRLIPKIGRENLYHVRPQPALENAIRARMQHGVSHRHPVAGKSRGVRGAPVQGPITIEERLEINTLPLETSGRAARMPASATRELKVWRYVQ